MNQRNPLLLQEASFSSTRCKLYYKVNSKDDGEYPHFHVYNNENGKKKIDCCIRLDTNKYFLHGKHRFPICNRNILNIMVHDLMSQRQYNRTGQYLLLHTILVNEWNLGNRKKCYVNSVPDYSKITIGE